MPSDLSLWFPFYPKDFLSSLDVQDMTTEEIGAYLLLLMNAWLFAEKRCHLPADDARLRRITRMSAKRWEKSRELILKKFDVDGEMIYNARLLEIWNTQNTRHKGFSAGGRKGMDNRWGKGKTVDQEKPPKTRPKRTPVSPKTDETAKVVDRWVSLGKNPKDFSGTEDRTHRSIAKHLKKHGLEKVLLAVDRLHQDNDDPGFLPYIANAFGQMNKIAPYYAEDWKPAPAARSTRREDPRDPIAGGPKSAFTPEQVRDFREGFKDGKHETLAEALEKAERNETEKET